MRFEQDDPEVKGILDSGDQPHKVEAAVQAILSGRLTEALGRHATALKDAATASDKYADRLVQVTDRLGWATWALVVVAIVQIIVTLYKG